MNFETIPAKSLDGYIGRPDCMIIDLRDREEYCQGHIAGAVCIPFEQFQKSVPLRKNMRYVLYCERGAASLMAAKRLAGLGYQVSTVIGGILAYRGRHRVLCEEGVLDSGHVGELILDINDREK